MKGVVYELKPNQTIIAEIINNN